MKAINHISPYNTTIQVRRLNFKPGYKPGVIIPLMRHSIVTVYI